MNRKSVPGQRKFLIFTVIVLPVAWGLLLPYVPALRSLPEAKHGGSFFEAVSLEMERDQIGSSSGDHPRICHVQIVDFDADDLADIVVCDSVRDAVLWYRQTTDGKWDERVMADRIPDPAHATIVDLNADERSDVVVSVLGNIRPDDRKIGSVVWLENRKEHFQKHVLLDGVRRVADVQPGDFNGDGRLDLVVAEFGYARGRVLWLENMGKEQFLEHELLYAAGAIHVPVADYDGDGDLDIATVISQDREQVWGWENVGNGRFRRHLLYETLNYDLGSAGLVKSDLDDDGDVDLLLPAGDNLEYPHTYPQPYHGCFWLENRGKWSFEDRQIARFGGTYAAAVGDLDGDGHRDVVLASMFNEWHREGSASVVWLQNDGEENFQLREIDDTPIHLATVACGDLNNDGRDDIVSGGLNVVPPFDRMGRVNVWMSR